MKEKLLKEGYKIYGQLDESTTLYQKKVSDEKGIKYFINCYHYFEQDEMDSWAFKIQLDSIVGTYNIELFNAGDITVMNLETLMECEWINHGAKYYEEFVISEKSE